MQSCGCTYRVGVVLARLVLEEAALRQAVNDQAVVRRQRREAQLRLSAVHPSATVSHHHSLLYVTAT